MSVLDSFDQWKSFLHDRVEQAKAAGMSQDTIANLASHIGDYLSKEVDPKNREERLLSEMWKAADEEEQKALANVMVKMVQ
ncbi:MAG: DUF3243 domain-containing protein [Thermicanus sp.]|nr:DUF3243 domain-containing protein [Thermicanus sp.]